MNKPKSSDKPLIILTAGGTGGHVYPAEALAEELEKRISDHTQSAESVSAGIDPGVCCNLSQRKHTRTLLSCGRYFGRQLSD